MQFQEGECSNIANITRESDNEMRPVPLGCGQKLAPALSRGLRIFAIWAAPRS